MMSVITGGSGSGKSAFAEKRAIDLSGKNSLYYLATMEIYGEEGFKKVERHKRLRAGKGFKTIEMPRNIDNAVKIVEKDATLLLECMSNLTANEMFADGRIWDVDQVVLHILDGMEALHAKVKNLIIVTNIVFEDGITYEASTGAYMKALAEINNKLAFIAEEVTEVVVGIPVKVKAL